MGFPRWSPFPGLQGQGPWFVPSSATTRRWSHPKRHHSSKRTVKARWFPVLRLGKSGPCDYKEEDEGNITEKIENRWEMLMNGIGRGILIRLISEEIDPVTKSGKSVETRVRGWLPKPSEHVHILEYMADFSVPSDFGKPGAVLITNLHAKEFHLLEIVIHGFDDGPIFFPANTWIHSRNDIRRVELYSEIKHTYHLKHRPALMIYEGRFA
ncbi:hypothetical protein GQ457_03G000060 [Hibiscus cannabinus]